MMNSTKASSTFDYNTLWKSQDHKRQYAKYKLKKEELSKINFENVEKKLKSVKPKMGKSKRKQMDREDMKLFVETVLVKKNKYKDTNLYALTETKPKYKDTRSNTRFTGRWSPNSTKHR